MELFGTGFKVPTSVALGVGAIILLPVLTPVIAAVVRPLVKAGIKGGIVLFERGMEAIAEATEAMEDLVMEARAELAGGPGAAESADLSMTKGVGGDAS